MVWHLELRWTSKEEGDLGVHCIDRYGKWGIYVYVLATIHFGQNHFFCAWDSVFISNQLCQTYYFNRKYSNLITWVLKCIIVSTPDIAHYLVTLHSSAVGVGDSMKTLEYQDSITIVYHLSFEKLLSDSNLCKTLRRKFSLKWLFSLLFKNIHK